MADSGDVLSCSFCGTSQKQVKVLIGGSHAYICDQCVSRAHAVIAEPGHAASTAGTASTATTASTAGTAIGTMGQVPDEPGAQQCSFCGKSRHRVAAMVSAGAALICHECLELCDEIVSEVPPVPSR